jgi:putative sigma-54 modulation protein
MQTIISGHHLEVTPSLREYVHQKLARIDRHFDSVVDAHVLLSIENQAEKIGRQHAECNIHLKGHTVFAQSSDADLYAAIDDLVDKLDRQILRHKSKIQNHQHHAAKSVSHAELAG